jgi:hypothetical protein
MYLIVVFIMALGGAMMAYRSGTGYRANVPTPPIPAQTAPAQNALPPQER